MRQLAVDDGTRTSLRLPASGSRGFADRIVQEAAMIETLFEIGFVLALTLPTLAVLSGAILNAVPRFHPITDVEHVSVHS